MTVNSIVERITEQLEYKAKVDITENYSSELFHFYNESPFMANSASGGDLYIHPFSAIDNNNILLAVHREMVYIATQTVPLILLEGASSSATILRKLNATWNIRMPAVPVVDGELDIDEMLAEIAFYRALAYFGISGYSQNAKELLQAYDEAVEIPTIEEAEQSITFRFTADEATWHDTYQDGDTHMSINRNDVWGGSIPIGGGSGGGASTFKELTDTPSTLTANKFLKVNSAGTAVELGTVESGVSSFTALTDTPSVYVGGKYIAVNSGGTALELVTAPSGGGTDESIMGYPATMPYDFTQGTEVQQFIMLEADTTFDVKVDGFTPYMQVGRKYQMEIFPEGFTFSFNTSNLKVPADCPTFDGMEYAIIFNIQWDGDDIFVSNINRYV